MSYKSYIKYTCDACGYTDGTVQNQYFSYSHPEKWASIEIDWHDPEKKWQSETYDLCPQCTPKLIEAILRKELHGERGSQESGSEEQGASPGQAENQTRQ